MILKKVFIEITGREGIDFDVMIGYLVKWSLDKNKLSIKLRSRYTNQNIAYKLCLKLMKKFNQRREFRKSDTKYDKSEFERLMNCYEGTGHRLKLFDNRVFIHAEGTSANVDIN